MRTLSYKDDRLPVGRSVGSHGQDCGRIASAMERFFTQVGFYVEFIAAY